MGDFSQDLPDSFVCLISSYSPSVLHLLCHFTNDSRVANLAPSCGKSMRIWKKKDYLWLFNDFLKFEDCQWLYQRQNQKLEYSN